MKSPKDQYEYCRQKARQFQPLDDNDRACDETSAVFEELGFSEEQTYVLKDSGADLVLYASRLIEQGRLRDMDGAILGAAISGILRIMLRAQKGEEFAQTQLAAMEKVLYPGDYDFDALYKALSLLAGDTYEISAKLLRGREIQTQMRLFSLHAEPADPEEAADWERPQSAPRRRLDPDEKIRLGPGADQRAASFWQDGDTMRTLAVRMYLGDHPELTTRACEEAFRAAEEWDSEHPEFPGAGHSIDSVLVRQESAKAEAEKFYDDLASAIVRLFEAGMVRANIAQWRVANEMGIGDSQNKKTAANNLWARLKSHGITDDWPLVVEKVIDDYIENRQRGGIV